MKTYHYVESGYSPEGERIVLWHTGNYDYEIELGESVRRLPNTSFEEAKAQFQKLCEAKPNGN
jgi:hypothetical protein